DVEPPRRLIQLFIRPIGMRNLDSAREQIVIPHEQRFQRGQFNVFISTPVSSGEKLVGGDRLGVVRHVQRRDFVRGEVTRVGVRQLVSGAGIKEAALKGSQGVRDELARAVNLRQVQVRSNNVYLLGRSCDSSCGVNQRTEEFQRLRTNRIIRG